MKFRVSDEMFKKYPDIVEYIVVGMGLDNQVSSKEINDLLDNTAKSLKGDKKWLDDEKYLRWLNIYNSIKQGYLPSHIALAKRAIEGKRIPHINPIVNLYNFYSLKYGIPVGGEDLSKVCGDLLLKHANGGELFLGMGESRIEKVEKGEVVWVDDHSVTCRMWAWRQSERTKLTKNSKDVYFIIDSFSDDDLNEVMENFIIDLKKYFGGEYQILKLDSSSRSLSLQYNTRVLKSGYDTNRDLEQLIGSGKKGKNKSQKDIFQRRAKSMDLVDQNHLVQRLSSMVDEKILETGISEKSELQLAQNSRFGDFSSTIALRESKIEGKSSKEIAEMVVKELSDLVEKGVFSKIEVAKNGFINLFLSESFIIKEFINNLDIKDKYGNSDTGKEKTMVVESPSINPNAPAHIGHLRNLLIGRGLARLLESVGFKVESDNLINDKDNKVCMAMWGYRTFGDGKTPEEENIKKDHFVGKYYALGRNKYNTDPKAKEEINEMLKKLENNDKETVDLWEKVTNWAFTGQLETFERLNEDRGFLWFESELWEGGKRLIEEYIGKGVVERLPDGAVVGRIEENYGVPDVVLLRRDGTSVYHTQDFNLTIKKVEKYKPWKAIWVVGNEHILHFQRLFALLDALKILKIDNLYAYVYGMVLGKDGKKISSRSGDDANADQLLDMAYESAIKVLENRDINQDKKNEIAEKVGQGAIRFEILSKDAYKDIILDIDRAVSFTGKSGSYVMYAYTRAKSILRNLEETHLGDVSIEKIDDVERNLILKLLNYPDVVLSCANNYSLSSLAEYSYEIANLFNNFYEKCPVIKASENQKGFRKAIVELSANVLKHSLGILGIEVIDEM